MAKSKKSDSKKAPKDKDLKALKAEKPNKEKKGKKKDKAVKEPIPPAPAPVKKAATPARPKKAAAPEVTFTTEEISLRAYFIAERRQAMGWSGDSSSDWVEAERQLKSEAKKAAR